MNDHGSATLVLAAVRSLPDGIEALSARADAEGFPFVPRLVREWRSGENNFSAPGECFLAAHRADRLVGFGGLNVDPYLDDPRVGRIRHVYVDPQERAGGVGGALVSALVARATPAFTVLRLVTQQAGPFYEKLGFTAVQEERATHRLVLVGEHTEDV